MDQQALRSLSRGGAGGGIAGVGMTGLGLQIYLWHFFCYLCADFLLHLEMAGLVLGSISLCVVGSKSNSSGSSLQQSGKLQGRWVENCSDVLTLRCRTCSPQAGLGHAALGWVLSRVPPAALLVSVAGGVWGR